MAYPAINPAEIYSLSDIERMHEARKLPANSWFYPATLRAFSTRRLPEVYKGDGGVYFIVTQQFKYGSMVEPRFHQVCKFYLDSASVLPVGPKCHTKGEAIKQATRYANEVNAYQEKELRNAR